MGDGELGISLISDLLNSGYPEVDCYQMASEVVQMLGKWYNSAHFPTVKHTWITPLFDFLSLCEKFYTTELSPSQHPGFIALHILSSVPLYDGFHEPDLPVLISMLLSTHPLQSRRLALGVFDRFTNKWVSLQMEDILSKDLNKLLQAVGDPLQFSDFPLQAGQSIIKTNYKPMVAAVRLIELASLDVWQNHLHHLNFTSCEEITSTRRGKRALLECMFGIATHSRSGLLHTPAKMITAIKRLEELQCLNTAEVLMLWAWTTGIVNPVDCDSWKLVGDYTLTFYGASHRKGQLVTLSQHITDTTMTAMHTEFLIGHYGDTSCQVQKPPLPVAQSPDYTDLCISQACQLRRLYHLF